METKQKIAIEVIKIGVQQKRPLLFAEVIKVIRNVSGIKVDHKGLSAFLQTFPDNFEAFQDQGKSYVKLITNLSICDLHCSNNESCAGGTQCTGLHICKFYLLQGKCKFGGVCRYGHDLSTIHNSLLLRENLLNTLCVDDIRYLLNLTENRTKSTIPKICKFYNLADGCRQSATGKCPFLHICKFYLQGNCQFNAKCSRSHDIDANVKRILNKHGIDTAKPIKDLLRELRVLYRGDGEETEEPADTHGGATARWSSQPSLNQASGGKHLDPERAPPQSLHRDSLASAPITRNKLTRAGSVGDLGSAIEHVCLYHLRGKCAFGKSCRNYHGDLPYQWQYRPVGENLWEDVDQDENWQLDLTYSDPKNSEAYLPLSNKSCMKIKFSKMRGIVKGVGEFDVRRLSTVSSGEASAEPLATDWIWYWIDNNQEWIKYGDGTKLVKRAYSTTVTSDNIERVYLTNPVGQMRFCTEGHEYVLDFALMVQINVKVGTERPVRRRPVFVKDLGQIREKVKSSKTGPPTSDSVTGGEARVSYPADWAVHGGRDIRDHFCLTKITKKTNAREYSKVESLFFETMPNTATITCIERVENGELWMDYCFKKNRMQKKSSKGTVYEKQLFHGTKAEYVDAICRQNFDFRLSGQSYGTRYGKGSYFALEAKYSDKYTDSCNRIVFVVKVLVGEYKQGEKSFVRPPSKDPSSKTSDLYDSCVDDERNPKIFVIFDLYQAYPEFVIKYDIKAPQFSYR